MKPISDKLWDFTGQNIYEGMDVHHKSCKEWKLYTGGDGHYLLYKCPFFH